ncbi:hypothetical protein I302_105207 [Kwoniella bestiolae CBS 10118]|uniref:Major facilitator superfamily (MFS) profile domain-containing protein n=1 Tax=Kwoniella bestiolae CBS 10118 TaxID=1296100 RepID=A0A1B9FSH1_9TREE|nr:hypothetical protein I302_08495 [Kwoniella bestiolae CBS 10118]OCF21718.1 hypothetical protein I302_08495 [Kwoniella bestiolae CBS 10118]
MTQEPPSTSPSSPQETPVPLPLTPPPPTLSRSRQSLIVLALALHSVLDATAGLALNIALPTIQEELNMGEKEGDLQWVVSAYHLATGCLLLFCGKLADNFGRKRVLISGVVLFGSFQFGAGFMRNGTGLICARAISGAGIAMSVPSAGGILAENFTGKARSIAFTCYAAGFAMGGILGIILGGLFVSYVRYTWRGVQFFLGGMCLLNLIMTILFIPWDRSHTQDKRIDWVGACLLTCGLGLFMFSINGAHGAPKGWKTSYIIALLLLGVLLITIFFFWEHHLTHRTSRPPLMRLALWTRAHGRMAALYFTAFLGNMGYINALYNATLYYQDVRGTGPIGAMLRFLPVEVSAVFCTVFVALFIHRVPAYWLLVVGLLTCGLANMCFALSGEETNYWKLPFHGMWLVTCGVYLFMPTGLIFVSHFALSDEYSVATGLYQTMTRLGISVGLSLMSIIVTSIKNQNLAKGRSQNESLLRGLQSGFWLTAALCWVGVGVAAIALRRLGTVGKNEETEHGDPGGDGRAGRAGEGDVVGEAGKNRDDVGISG